LLKSHQRSQIEPLPVGNIAATDILAPEDLKIEDALETERQRDKAALSVLPVFDYNPKAGREVIGNIKQIFNIGREAEPDAKPEQIIQKIQDETGISLDDEQFGVLLKHRFNFELEKLMTDHFEVVMSSGVVSSRNQLLKFGATGIARRDLKNNNEMVVSDLSPIRDLITARAQLRSDKFILPAEYDAHQKKLLAEILGSLLVPNLDYNDTETEARRE